MESSMHMYIDHFWVRSPLIAPGKFDFLIYWSYLKGNIILNSLKVKCSGNIVPEPWDLILLPVVMLKRGELWGRKEFSLKRPRL